MLTSIVKCRKEKPAKGNLSTRAAFAGLAMQLDRWADKTVMSEMAKRFPMLFNALDGIRDGSAWQIATPTQLATHGGLAAPRFKHGLAEGKSLETILDSIRAAPEQPLLDGARKAYIFQPKHSPRPSTASFHLNRSDQTPRAEITAQCLFNHGMAKLAQEWITAPIADRVRGHSGYSTSSKRFGNVRYISHSIRFGGGRDSFSWNVDGMFIEDHAASLTGNVDIPFDALVQFKIIDDFIM